MLTLLLIVLAITGLLVVMRREAGAPAALAVLGVLGLVGLLFDAEVIGALLLIGAVAVAAAGLPALRIKWLTPRIFATFKKVAPKVSATERTALEAGSV
ncbi:MAG TPA: acyl-CoA dehydrogenase, partial [Halomonas sp.]|nr:acyl-CoA dehydrogenase [Halomonas sp.]